MEKDEFGEIEISKDYYDILKENAIHSEKFGGILKYLPDFYRILCNIITDKKTSWYARILVNSALAYLVLEQDIIPDKKGEKGYLDDLFLCSYILKEIRDKISKEIILSNLHDTSIGARNGEIFDLIYEVNSKCADYLDGKEAEILNLVGISKFNALDLLCANDRKAEITKGKKKLKLLYAMAAVIIREKIVGWTFDTSEFGDDITSQRVKDYILNHPEYGEIKRYGAFLEDD